MSEADVRLVIKEPGVAYISDRLWLPKDKLARLEMVKSALTVIDESGKEPVTYTLWNETPSHMIVPREFINSADYSIYDFPFIDIAPRTYSRTHITDQIKWRDSSQRDAWRAMESAHGGILNLACGKGKTVLALKKISQLNVPTLIVVNDGVQFAHWIGEIEEHLALPEGEIIGQYQGQTLDWKHPITVATIQTLATHVREGKIPPGFRDWFGVVIYEEVHHLPAPFFLLTADLVSGQRFGLTATTDRLDRKEWVYKYHLGAIFHSDLTQDLIPKVYIQETDVIFDERVDDIRDKAGEISVPKLRTALAYNWGSMQVREFCIKEALDNHRKILCVSHSKDMLKFLHQKFPDSALCIAETPKMQRIPMVRASRLAFAIARLGIECLNDKALDALLLLTPFGSPNDLQQLLGRIQRDYPDKMPPVAVIFDDKRVPKLHRLVNSLRRTLRKKWAIESKVLSPPQMG